jgi:hypothetical protein
MAKKRSFHIVLVTENRGAGSAESSTFDQEAMYSGEAVSVTTQ